MLLNHKSTFAFDTNRRSMCTKKGYRDQMIRISERGLFFFKKGGHTVKA